MFYAPCIRESLENYLKKNRWQYNVDEEKNAIVMNMGLKKSKLQECGLLIYLRENYYIVYATTEIRAGEDCRDKVADYLSRANYGLRWGNFEIDMSDGEIRYKVLVDCGKDCDCMPSDSVIEHSLYYPISTMEKYGDNLLAVMFGFMTPTEAIEKAEAEA